MATAPTVCAGVPRAQGTPKGTIELADLPREVLLHIAHFIERPSHLLAARMAARLFDPIDVARRAAEWAACPAHAAAVIRSRAPRDLVARALPLYSDHTSWSLLGVAVAGGRLDVVRLVHQFIEVLSAIPRFFVGPCLFFPPLCMSFGRSSFSFGLGVFLRMRAFFLLV